MSILIRLQEKSGPVSVSKYTLSNKRDLDIVVLKDKIIVEYKGGAYLASRSMGGKWFDNVHNAVDHYKMMDIRSAIVDAFTFAGCPIALTL